MMWHAPEETGGVPISTYTVTVGLDGRIMSENVSSRSGILQYHQISGLEYNRRYNVEVIAINACGIPSQPADTQVTIYATGQWNSYIDLMEFSLCFL